MLKVVVVVAALASRTRVPRFRSSVLYAHARNTHTLTHIHIQGRANVRRVPFSCFQGRERGGGREKEWRRAATSSSARENWAWVDRSSIRDLQIPTHLLYRIPTVSQPTVTGHGFGFCQQDARLLFGEKIEWNLINTYFRNAERTTEQDVSDGDDGVTGPISTCDDFKVRKSERISFWFVKRLTVDATPFKR